MASTIQVSPEVRAEADADKLLSWLFDEQIKREGVRHDYWMQDYRRAGSGGVSFGGSSLRPFEPATDVELLEAAKREHAGRMAYAAKVAA